MHRESVILDQAFVVVSTQSSVPKASEHLTADNVPMNIGKNMRYFLGSNMWWI